MFKITPREPTDDEIDRACAAGNFGTGREMMRIMLRAALNPPAEPEIAVTEAMLDAACGILRWFVCHTDSVAKKYARQVAADLYRAMFAARPKPEVADQYPPRPGAAAEAADQRRRTSEMRRALDEGIIVRANRRKDDPR